jgi:hypothetical protein
MVLLYPLINKDDIREEKETPCSLWQPLKGSFTRERRKKIASLKPGPRLHVVEQQ